MDAFYEKEHQADKLVIVGHWPTVNYRTRVETSHMPLIDKEKKIISLDGGNQIKKDGQLNALIIHASNFSTYFVDELQKAINIKRMHIEANHRVGVVAYPNYKMKVIK